MSVAVATAASLAVGMYGDISGILCGGDDGVEIHLGPKALMMDVYANHLD